MIFIVNTIFVLEIESNMNFISTLDPSSLHDKNFYVGKSILITGATGVVGFNLAYTLLTIYGKSISLDLIGRSNLTSCQSKFLDLSNANFIKLDLDDLPELIPQVFMIPNKIDIKS